MIELLFMFSLFTKHFVVDFLWQGPYQYRNKGTYGHPGGILHSFLHGVATSFIAGSFVDIQTSIFVGLIDFFLHYHIDWAKVKINEKYKLAPNTHKEYWYLLGMDQYMHALTYLFIAYLILV